jgi:hypothetical protein
MREIMGLREVALHVAFCKELLSSAKDRNQGPSTQRNPSAAPRGQAAEAEELRGQVTGHRLQQKKNKEQKQKQKQPNALRKA